MGEILTKNTRHQLLEHLQHTYQPYFQSRLIPGHPTYLKVQNQSSMPALIAEWTQRYPVIDCYQLLLKLSEQDWKRETMIYEYRKATYPYFVQVIYYELQKQQCECASGRYRLWVYTQHIAYRLGNFRLCKNIETNNNKHEQLQQYESLSLDEGIYMLINCLHAYQLLAEQYWVNYPTVFTIGVTEKAQVKVWINENWAVNQQNYRRIPQSLIIEEIVNLIEERMEGNFEEILNSRYNYMNFTFDSIQQILSQYTINFHKGKLALEKKITAKINEETETKRVTEKLTTKMTPYVGMVQQKTTQAYKNTDNTVKLLERRYLSQQYPKSHYTETYTPYSCKKNTEATQNIAASSPPKKSIKFTYQHGTQVSSKQLKFKTSPLKKQSASAQITTVINNSPIKAINTVNPNFSYTAVPNKSKNIILSHQNQKASLAQSLVDRKLHLGARNKYHQKKNSGLQSKLQAIQKKTQVPCQVQHRDKISLNRPHADLSKRDSERKSELLMPLSQKENEKQKVNIRDITSEFIILLQSDKRISQNDDMNMEFYTSPFQEDDDSPASRSSKLEQNFKASSFVRYIEQIKEEDEEINYSFEEVV